MLGTGPSEAFPAALKAPGSASCSSCSPSWDQMPPQHVRGQFTAGRTLLHPLVAALWDPSRIMLQGTFSKALQGGYVTRRLSLGITTTSSPPNCSRHMVSKLEVGLPG